MKFWKKYLTVRLSGSFLLLSMVMVVVVSGIAFLRARDSLKRAAFNQLDVAASLKEAEIARWFEDRQRDFLVLSRTPGIKTQLQTLLNRKPSERDYQTTYRIASEYLKSIIELKPNFQELYITDNNGRIVASTDKKREGLYETTATVTYIERVEIGDAFAPVFYVSSVTGKPAVTLGYLIRDAAGNRIGAMLANLNLERIDQIIRERSGLGNTGETYLVGSLVSDTVFISKAATPTKKSQTEPITSPSTPPGMAQSVDRLPESLTIQESEQSVRSAGIDAAMSGISGSGLYRNYAGIPVVGVYRWLNSRDIALLVEMHQEEAFAPARQLAQTIVLVGLVAAGALSLTVYWLSRRIAHPILAIADTAVQVAAGELAVTAPVMTEDEVGLLASQFNQMIRQLRISRDNSEHYSRSLEQKAQELEQALWELGQTQSQLVQSEKMSSLGQLVAGVAHEINNPVNFISGNVSHACSYAEQLLSLLKLYQQEYPNPTSKVQAQLQAIELDYIAEDMPNLLLSMQVGMDRISQIVSSLRTFSRTDEAEIKPVDIHEGIESTLMILKLRLKATQTHPEIQVIKDYGNLPKVECYAGQLNQVFMNLLANAIDAIEESNRGKTYEEISQNPNIIKIQTQAVDDWAVIQITDNGSGIPEAVRRKLFDPFFTTKPVGKGTGLGLSISHQIVVERHQGTLECISLPGQGAEFAIKIPLHLSALLENDSCMHRVKAGMGRLKSGDAATNRPRSLGAFDKH
jgi:signal transduction histidine kinase